MEVLTREREQSVMVQGSPTSPSTGVWAYVRTVISGVVSYRFRAMPKSEQRFDRGQIVRYLPEVAEEAVMDSGGHYLVVLDDDIDLIVSVENTSARRYCPAHVPTSDEEKFVFCRVLATGKRARVSRELLTPTGEQLSQEVLDELLFGWTGRRSSLQRPLAHLMQVQE